MESQPAPREERKAPPAVAVMGAIAAGFLLLTAIGVAVWSGVEIATQGGPKRISVLAGWGVFALLSSLGVLVALVTRLSSKK